MKQTIALVDDEETIRETVAFALRRDGYDVITFPDGAAAWDVVAVAAQIGRAHV